MSKDKNLVAILLAILAAALYAISTPVSKVMLQTVAPTMVAAFLYLGAGNTFVVSSEGCLPSDDNLHFCSEGYRLLGRHYVLRYLEVTNPQLAEVCRQKLSVAGANKGGTVSSKLTVETNRSGESLSVVALEPVEKVDVVSFSGQTVKVRVPSGKQLSILIFRFSYSPYSLCCRNTLY